MQQVYGYIIKLGEFLSSIRQTKTNITFSWTLIRHCTEEKKAYNSGINIELENQVHFLPYLRPNGNLKHFVLAVHILQCS